MEVIVHYPKSKEAQDELNKVLAIVHSDLVESFINSLPCSIEQKCDLFKSLCVECHKKTDNLNL